MTSPHDWDAAIYDRLATRVKALGHEVLDRLVLRGDEERPVTPDEPA